MKTKPSCRACCSPNLFEVIDMGHMPLAGDFCERNESNQLYPLVIDACETCGVLQVRETIEHSVLFNNRYSYISSAIPQLVKHFEDYALRVALPSNQYGKKRLLEIGCNDGVFLLPLTRAGYKCVGIDASENVALKAKAKGLDVKIARFNLASAKDLLNSYGPFDVITCSNTLAHNADVNEFIQSMILLLHPDGEFWVEVHSAYGLFLGLQWDCFYHEHCFYWSIHALKELFRKHDFILKKYETTPMHGGAIRAVFSRKIKPADIHEPILPLKDWALFGKRCYRNRSIIKSCIDRLQIDYAFGAAGRAVMLINWSRIDSHLRYVVDANPSRYGKVIPNTKIPIISEKEFFKERNPNGWCFVTAHNYLQGIRFKVEKQFPNQMIKFVTPLPHFRIQ